MSETSMRNFLLCLFAGLILPGLLSGCERSCTDSVPASFEHVLSEHLDPQRPGAAVIVVKNGTTLFRRASGMADLEQGLPLEPGMSFQIGSLTKPFTAAAIMLLSDRGQLSVDDAITRYLPGYPSHEPPITIEHLLTHTSGIKNYFDLPGFKQDLDKDISLHELIASFKNEPLEFPPGSRFAYSNSGYILLGAIIERISGQPYCRFMDQQLFKPLGMTATHCANPGQPDPALATGYSRNQRATPASTSKTFSAGALVSTVDDLARWNAAMTAGALLRQDTWQRIFTPYVLTDGQPSEVAFGWGLGSIKEHPAVGHEGKINGYSSMMVRLPEDDIFVAVLSNDDRLHLFSAIEDRFADGSPSCLAAQLVLRALEDEP